MTRKQKRMALIGAAASAAGLALFLVLSALETAVAYFYTPADLAAREAPPEGLFRLGGLVEDGSVEFLAGDAGVRFVIVDEIARMPVRYEGILPDLFREGQGVVVQGRMNADGGVDAVEVLAKHDETYMPREVAEALKEQGRWREGSE